MDAEAVQFRAFPPNINEDRTMKVVISKEIMRKINVGRIPIGLRVGKSMGSKRDYNRKREKSIPKE